jgi:CP family cyanate transporter-like MFS transporter
MSLSNGMAGLITTFPLIAFGIFSPFIPKLSRRYGFENILFLGLVILVLGILLRSTPSIPALFMGTFIIGIAIAICNVLLPSLIKQKFPKKMGLWNGLYITVMVMCAAFASGLISPFNQYLDIGWRGTLAFQAVLAGLAILIWLPQLHNNRQLEKNPGKISTIGGLLHSPLAWQVTFFMGLQSLIFFILVAWLPEILIEKGFSISQSGWYLSLIQFSGLPATFIVPILSDRYKNQRLIVVFIALFNIVGFVGIFFGSIEWTFFLIMIICLSSGASISLALALFGLRARNSQQAAELSGMAQSFGYILGAIGPVAFGFLYDVTHEWTIPMLMLIGASVCLLFAGLGAGRDKYVS